MFINVELNNIHRMLDPVFKLQRSVALILEHDLLQRVGRQPGLFGWRTEDQVAGRAENSAVYMQMSGYLRAAGQVTDRATEPWAG